MSCIIFQHVAIDVLVRSSMKSATKCDMLCDLYDSANLNKLELILSNLMNMSVYIVQCRADDTALFANV